MRDRDTEKVSEFNDGRKHRFVALFQSGQIADGNPCGFANLAVIDLNVSMQIMKIPCEVRYNLFVF